MKDYNFFDPYIKQERVSHYKRFYGILSIITVVLIMTTISVVNIFRIKFLNDDISELQVEIDSPEAKRTLEELAKYRGINDILTKYHSQVKFTDESIKKIDIISNKLLDKTFSTVPQDVYIQSMTINGKDIQLQCYTKKIVSSAEFLYNLKNVGLFEKVYIPGIQGGALDKDNSSASKDGKFTFSVTCVLKDVNLDES